MNINAIIIDCKTAKREGTEERNATMSDNWFIEINIIYLHIYREKYRSIQAKILKLNYK